LLVKQAYNDDKIVFQVHKSNYLSRNYILLDAIKTKMLHILKLFSKFATPMNKNFLIEEIKKKQSLICVGLDSDINKLPKHLPKTIEGIITFNHAIIEATHEYAVSYKINTAFYEQYGAAGWMCMEETLKKIPKNCFTIADAKRGDIGNTSSMYAKAFFETLNFDAITVAPYMGEDSLKPFFEFKDKWVICLGLTSNMGSQDFQMLDIGEKKLYQTVMQKVSQWSSHEQLMFVTGTTKASMLKQIRVEYPEHFFLVPGVGAQGGTVKEVCTNAKTEFGGLLINASRSIIYSSSDEDFAEKAKLETINLQKDCF
jgi:orotidine-5'-phosphate decarboxylase